jgi:hypothetical protein
MEGYVDRRVYGRLSSFINLDINIPTRTIAKKIDPDIFLEQTGVHSIFSFHDYKKLLYGLAILYKKAIVAKKL